MMTFSDSDSDSDNPIPKIQNCDNNGDIVPQFLAQSMNNTSSKQPSKNVLSLLEAPKFDSISHGSSFDSLLDDDSDTSTTFQNKQLYLFVARCIAYPFNAKLHVETAPSKPKLNENMHTCIHDVLKQCVEQDKSLLQQLILNNSELKCIRNKDFQAMVNFYLNVILVKDDIKTICYRGCFSTKELENIFRVITFKHFRGMLLFKGLVSSTDNVTKQIENDPAFQVWISTFGKLIELGRQNSMSTKRHKELNRQLTGMQTGNKEDMYRLFQDILKVSRKDHQSFVQLCQLNSTEEQEGIIRRELHRRKELIEKKVLPVFWNTQSYLLKDHFLQEQERNLKILSENLENESLISSDFGLKHKKKKADESGGGAEPSKHDVNFNKKVKVTVRSLSQITNISEDKAMFIVFDVVDGDKPLATDMIEMDSNRSAIYDTTGEFWTHSPLPQIVFKVKVLTRGLLHEDKLIAKVSHIVMPSANEIINDIPITRVDKHNTPIGNLKIATFLERPNNMRKCGYLYCQGDYIFKEWKSRFLALILLSQFRFLLCHYLPKDNYPKDIISLDGCNVDYLNDDDDKLSKELPYGFILTTSKGSVTFACKTHSDRELWVNGLFRVTGQSNKPSNEQDGGSTCNSDLQGTELAEIINMDVSQLDHQYLFTKLFKDILSYRLDQHVFSRGLFSSSQMYVVDEYCARYNVRLSHRHLTCLREWLNCELRGISIWPVMMLHSFGFCQMHIMGKAPQQHSEVVTPQERLDWSELSAQIELLLTEKLENFRTYFPYSCPKDDLKITMKLFSLVADINHSDEEILISASAVLISENHPMKLLNTIMETAALNNFRQIYSQLWPEEHEECMNVEQVYVLAKLCIEYMYELHDFYNEDFVLYPEAFNSHIDAFWSFFMVDLKETMNCLKESDIVSLLKMFYSLNEYFILQPTLILCTFHKNLLSLFEPLVDNYLTGLDTSISKDLRAFFDNETWLPVSECCKSMKGCIDALESVKQFVENLHWPQQPFADDLIYKVQCICAEKFKDAVRFTRLQCETITNNITVSFETVVPKPAITMINTMMFLSVQAVPFCGLNGGRADAEELDRHSELSNEIQSFLETTLGDVFRTVIQKLCEPLQVVLKQMSKLDPQTGLLSTFKSMLPISINTEQYSHFLKLNFQHLSGTLVIAVFNQFILNWYESQLRIVARWLRNRPDFSLHTVQLESVKSLTEIIRQQFHQEEDDIDEEQLNTDSYEEIIDRIKREHQQAVMMKAFKKQ